MAKILRNLEKITRLNFQKLVFLMARNRYLVVIPFEMLNMEFILKYTILITKVNHFSQFISVKVKKNLRKFQAQFREKLRKLRLRQITVFL